MANRRRQEKRWDDDVVRCPLCLMHPWDRGRSSNCQEHILRGKCASRLVEAWRSTKTHTGMLRYRLPNGGEALLWTTPGPGRRKRRRYVARIDRNTPEIATCCAQAESHSVRVLDAAPLWNADPRIGQTLDGMAGQ